jgi:hypothetical protein
MTPSQAKSPSAPEAIEDQLQSGGPYGTLSLFGGAYITLFAPGPGWSSFLLKARYLVGADDRSIARAAVTITEVPPRCWCARWQNAARCHATGDPTEHHG